MNDQMRGVAIAIGLLNGGGYPEAAHWLHELMTEEASDDMVEALRQLNEEIGQLDELPAPHPID